MHEYFVQHHTTVTTASRILELFNEQGTESVLEGTPEAIHLHGEDVIESVNRIQCGQAGWDARVHIVHRANLSLSRVVVSITFNEQRARLHLAYKPYANIAYVIKEAQTETELVNALQVLRYSLKNVDERSIYTGFNHEEFWNITRRIAVETGQRNNKATSRRRTRTSRRNVATG